MNGLLERRYEELDTDQLIRIAYIEPYGYQKEAVELAKKILESRNIRRDSNAVAEAINKNQMDQEKIDNEPLTKKQQIIFFLCGLFFITFFVALFYIEANKNERGAKRTKESWKWMWMGLGAMALTHILFMVIMYA